MDERTIGRILRKEFRLIGWLLLGYYLLMNVIALLAMVVQIASHFLRNWNSGSVMPDMDALLGNGWGYLLSIAVGMLILAAWKDRAFWKEAVFARNRRMRPGVFFLMLCLCMTAQLFNGFWITGLEWLLSQLDISLTDLLEQVSGDTDTFSMFLYASIVAPVVEELLFRGWIQKSLRPYGRNFSIFCSAFLFGVFHGNLIQTPYAFVMGLVLGYAAAEYHIGWAIGLHMFNNLVLADLYSRISVLLPEFLELWLLPILMVLAAIVSGIWMVCRRKDIARYIAEDRLDRRCVKWFFLNSGTIVLMIVMLLSALTIFLG